MRPSHLLIVTLLAPTACKKEQPSPPAEVAARLAQEAAAPAPEEAPPDGRKITPTLVEKLLAYQKVEVELFAKYTTTMRANLEKVKNKGGDEGLKVIADNDEAHKRYTEESAKALKAVGLTAGEAERTWTVVQDVVVTRMAWRRRGGDKMLEDMKQKCDALPADRRTEGEAQIAQFKRRRDATDARETHGDATVDAILKHEADFEAYQDKLIALTKLMTQSD